MSDRILKGWVVFRKTQRICQAVCLLAYVVWASACGNHDNASPDASGNENATLSATAEAGLPKEWAEYGKAGLELSAEQVFIEALQVANSGDLARANDLVDASMQAAFFQGSIDKYWRKVTRDGAIAEFAATRVQPKDDKTKLRVTVVFEDGAKLHINQSLSKKEGKWLLVND